MAWIDLHIDTLWRMRLAGLDPLRRGGPTRLQVDVAGARAIDLRAAVWATYVEPEHTGLDGVAETVRRMGAGLDLAARSRGRLSIVRGRADLERCLRGSTHGMILGLEGAHSLDGSLELFEALHAAGLRVLTLTWNHSNPFAAGCGADGREDTGLTPLGRRLVAVAERLGVLIDLAHASPRTLSEVLDCAARPVMVSHTACRALREHRRNLSDDQLRRVAASGGLIGLTLCPAFLADTPEQADSRRLADHVVHAAALAGGASVALGSDLDGIETTPRDLRGVRDLPRIDRALGRRGLRPMERAGFAWRNAARFLRAALDTPAGGGERR